MPPILGTGAAGFIGFHLSCSLLDRGFEVIGVDNLTPYYDPDLKQVDWQFLTRKTTFHLLNWTVPTRSPSRSYSPHTNLKRCIIWLPRQVYGIASKNPGISSQQH